MTRPAYAELRDGRASAVFGEDDRFGCLNLLTPERVAAAARLVVTGEVFSLNASVRDWPDPNPPQSPRSVPTYEIFELVPGVVYDDVLNRFYPQASSQWDGFLHVRDAATGEFYGGQTEPVVGVEMWARRGIAGRGALLDVERWWRETRETPLDWQMRTPITTADLIACADHQGVTVSEGTILLLRFGWQSGYSALDVDDRAAYAKSPQAAPGLDASPQVAGLLWDWGVAAVAADTIALEAKPYDRPVGEILHTLLLSRLGMPMGELWLLDELAAACAAARRYEFFLTSAPMNVRGGVGSPANVLAIM
jgi:kynurenine formamidase